MTFRAVAGNKHNNINILREIFLAKFRATCILALRYRFRCALGQGPQMNKSKDDFTKRRLLSMSVDMANAVETVERLRVQFAALAKEHGVSLSLVTAECM